MCVIYFVWYFSIFLLYFSKILATNIDSITSYSKIREEIKSMYVCMYVSFRVRCTNSFERLKIRFKISPKTFRFFAIKMKMAKGFRVGLAKGAFIFCDESYLK